MNDLRISCYGLFVLPKHCQIAYYHYRPNSFDKSPLTSQFPKLIQFRIVLLCQCLIRICPTQIRFEFVSVSSLQLQNLLRYIVRSKWMLVFPSVS